MLMLTDGLEWWTRRFGRAPAPTTAPAPTAPQRTAKPRRGARAERAPREPEREGAPATGRFARGALQER